MAYPEDVKKKAYAKMDKGVSVRKIAKLLDVHFTTVQIWKNRRDQQPVKYYREPYKISEDALRADIEKYPYDYQYERAQRFGCSDVAICKAMKKYGLKNKRKGSRNIDEEMARLVNILSEEGGRLTNDQIQKIKEKQKRMRKAQIAKLKGEEMVKENASLNLSEMEVERLIKEAESRREGKVAPSSKETAKASNDDGSEESSSKDESSSKVSKNGTN